MRNTWSHTCSLGQDTEGRGRVRNILGSRYVKCIEPIVPFNFHGVKVFRGETSPLDPLAKDLFGPTMIWMTLKMAHNNIVILRFSLQVSFSLAMLMLLNRMCCIYLKHAGSLKKVATPIGTDPSRGRLDTRNRNSCTTTLLNGKT